VVIGLFIFDEYFYEIFWIYLFFEILNNIILNQLPRKMLQQKEEEKKFIEINPNLLAHNLKNAGKKRSAKNHDGDSEGMEERRPPARIQMNEQLKRGSSGGVRKTQNRKSLLREYRKKQEELLDAGGESLVYNKDENRLILGGSGFKIDTGSADKNTDFMESVNFMKHLEEEIIEKAREPSLLPPKPSVAPPTPDYGCLKNGNIPTFRQWTGQQPGIQRKTQRLNVRYSPGVSDHDTSEYSPQPLATAVISEPTPLQTRISTPYYSSETPEPEPFANREPSFVPPILTLQEREAQEKAREINEKLKLKLLMKEREEEARKREEEMGAKLGKRKKTVRRKLHTGKINDRVSILIPNKTIRNRFHNLTQKMHQTSIQEIKKYLLKRGFIKVGTSAPPEILRKMYEDLHMLGGEIQNLNGENIVYNFKAASGGEG